MNKAQLLNIIGWIFIIIAVILLVWRMFGNSPATDNLIIALMVGLLFQVSSMDTKLSTLEVRLTNLERDFKEHVEHFKEHIRHK